MAKMRRLPKSLLKFTAEQQIIQIDANLSASLALIQVCFIYLMASHFLATYFKQLFLFSKRSWIIVKRGRRAPFQVQGRVCLRLCLKIAQKCLPPADRTCNCRKIVQNCLPRFWKSDFSKPGISVLFFCTIGHQNGCYRRLCRSAQWSPYGL